jgi:dephospho-CoA kinase
LLASHGAVVIDYDQLAREAVEPGGPALAEIARRFGDEVIAPDGSLDRPALGAVVFADDDALKDLNAITHPAIGRLAVARENAAGPDAIVVHDNPLLVEMGAAERCDVVIVVDVPEDVQVERLVSLRGMSEDEARARIAAQAPREKRTGAADLVIDNTGPLDELARIVGGVWNELVSRAASGEARSGGS